MAGVSLQRVTKVHRDRLGREVVALREASVEVGDGEFLVVVGPSGSGKTTMLRLIAGLEQPTSGEIAMGGRSMRGVSAADRDVAMVFQDHPLFPHLDVTGNLRLGLELRKVARAEREVRVGEVLEMLGLAALKDRMPGELSGGERQRVALGMALVRRPRVLLLDEPLAHLDGTWRLALRREFAALQRQMRLTWIQVTHDPAEALAMADRLVVLEAGTVLQAGTPREVHDRPATRFVAGFVGMPGMNLLSGTWEGGVVRWRFRLPCGGVLEGGEEGGEGGLGGGGVFRMDLEPEGPPGETPAATNRRFLERADAEERMLGVRPEAIRLGSREAGGKGAGGEVWADGEVEVVEFVGSECWVHVRVGRSGWLVVREPNPSRWRAGEAVRVLFSGAAVHWFDASTGRRVECLPTTSYESKAPCGIPSERMASETDAGGGTSRFDSRGGGAGGVEARGT